MEILIGAVIVLAGVGYKKLVGRFGYDIVSAGMLVFAFVLSGIAAVIYSYFGDTTLWKELVNIFGVQMAIYEVVLKRLIPFLKSPAE